VNFSANISGDLGKISVFLIAINLYGCTFTEEIETPKLPPALVEPLPIKVGVYFDHDFENYQYRGPIDPREESVKIEINFGSANIDLFKQVFTQSFETVVVVDQWPLDQTLQTDFDALIRPMISDLSSSSDLHSSGGPYVYSRISYGFEFLEPNGEQIILWNISDTPKGKPPSFNGPVTSLQARVLEEQMRLIAARFLTEFPQQPEVRSWLRDKQYR
jgi:hypothetical protein